MILQVNDRYRLVSDELQWAVQRLPITPEGSEPPKKDNWKNIAYYTELDSAVLFLAQHRIKALPGHYDACDALTPLCNTLDDIKKMVGELQCQLSS